MVEFIGGSCGHFSEEEVLRRAQSGDQEAIEVLMVRFRALVEARSRLYFVPGAERDDVIQEGMIGLYQAIRDYQPAPKRGFVRFAELCITRRILDALKGSQRQKHQALNASVSIEDPYFDPAYSRRPDPEFPLDPHLLSQSAKLSDLEMKVLRGYLEGLNYRELGAALGCPPKRVDNALQRVKRKLNRVSVSESNSFR